MRIETVNLRRRNERVVTVGIVQPRLRKDDFFEKGPLIYPRSEKAVLDRVLRFTDQALRHKVNILCFPELSTSAETTSTLLEFANKTGMIVIGGSYYDDNRRNVAPIMVGGRKDLIITEKITPSPFEQSIRPEESAVAGDTIRVVKNSGFGTFGVLICSDFLNDDIKSRVYSRKDLDFLFVISINRAWEDYHRDMCSDCIKSENGLYIGYASAIWVEGEQVIGAGRSAIFGVVDKLFLDEEDSTEMKHKILDLEESEDMIVAEFDITHRRPSLPRTVRSAPNIKVIWPPRAERRADFTAFLDHLRLTDERYRRLLDLFVAPEGYDTILNKLRTDRIVFLIGDAEIGKTYTSFMLLWDCYLAGYNPIYFSEIDTIAQIDAMTQKLTDVIAEKTAVYFEDPWGKTTLASAEHLFTALSELFSVLLTTDALVIITSREKLFRKLNDIKEFSEDLWGYVSKLKVGLSYSQEGLAKMLIKYLEVFQPAWKEDPDIVAMANATISKGTLKTPMSIKRLVLSRRARNTRDYSTVHDEAKAASKETSAVFSKEILAMVEQGQHEKVVFLSYPYMAQCLSAKEAEQHYHQALGRLNEKYGFDLIRALDFDDNLSSFQGDEVEIYKDCLRYSHPVYSDGFSEALKYKSVSRILDEVASELYPSIKGNWPLFKDIVDTVLRDSTMFVPVISESILSLAALDEDAASIVARAIIKHSENLKPAFRNAIYGLIKKPHVVESVVDELRLTFIKVPQTIREELLERVCALLADRSANISQVLLRSLSLLVERHFDQLTRDRRDGLIKNLARLLTDKRVLSDILVDQFLGLSDGEKIVLFQQLEDEGFRYRVWFRLDSDFDRVAPSATNQLIRALAEKCSAEEIARIILPNTHKLQSDTVDIGIRALRDRTVQAIAPQLFQKPFDHLSPKAILAFLEKLSKQSDIATVATWCLVNYFEKLERSKSESILIDLARNRVNVEPIVHLLAFKWIHLSGPGRKALVSALPSKDLLDLAQNTSIASTLAWLFARNFHLLTSDLRQYLFRHLFQQKRAAWVVVYGLISNAGSDPRELWPLIESVYERNPKTDDIQWYLVFMINSLERNYRNELYAVLINERTFLAVSKAVARSVGDQFFSILPRLRDELLEQLAQTEETRWLVAETLMDNARILSEKQRHLLLGSLYPSSQELLEFLGRRKEKWAIKRARSLMHGLRIASTRSR